MPCQENRTALTDGENTLPALWRGPILPSAQSPGGGGTVNGPSDRVARAFAHEAPDRTPLFEIFQPYHPIHWGICGRNPATDMAMAWDARAEGIDWAELVEMEARAQYEVCRYFGLDMVRLDSGTPRDYARPVRTGHHAWTLDGVEYRLNERIWRVQVANPADAVSYSERQSEEELRRLVEEWDGSAPPASPDATVVLPRVREMAEADGVSWVYMGEVGAGTGAAFYPPFQLMWLITEPELQTRWLQMKKARAFESTRRMIADGCTVVALGGDVSCDKGPFISPEHYRRFILPVIQEHVALVHDLGAKAVYTSDGNHWPIKEELFFRSAVDGYKEVDKAAGMTWPRLIAEGVAERVCIVGNIDARHALCRGTADEVKREVVECLEYGRRTPGGHILHASHSVHEDVRRENYYAVVDAYREFFGMEKLPQ